MVNGMTSGLDITFFVYYTNQVRNTFGLILDASARGWLIMTRRRVRASYYSPPVD